ncbi:MAG: GGDEF domain-containing protein [Candidatus Kaelpia aquatica]|nr:GGDEF domain-containing protein [Candidatus Kaelpia aquatica]
MTLMKEDHLTKFYTRDEFQPYVDSLTESEKNFTVGLIDLNHFKVINDKYGHMFGDSVLRYVSSTIKLTFEDRGVLFRYGGDEFVVVFPEQDKKYASILFRLCNRNLKKRPFLFKTKLLKISVSYGVASYPQDAVDIESLVHKADMAMYCSKKLAKGAVADIAKINIYRILILGKKILFWGAWISLISLIVFKPFKIGVKSFIASKKIEQSEVVLSYPCEVIFKNGYTLNGVLVERDTDTITLLIPMGGVEGKMKVDKSIIRKYRTFKP